MLAWSRRTYTLVAFLVGACTWTLDEDKIGGSDAGPSAGTGGLPDAGGGQGGSVGSAGTAGTGGVGGSAGASGMGPGGTAGTGGAAGSTAGASGAGGAGGCMTHQDCPAWVCICANDAKIAGFSCALGICRSGDSFCGQLCQDNQGVAAKGCYLQSNNTGGTAGAACGAGDGG